MRLLITGGAGSLGSSLVEKYLPDGYEIFVIDNFITGKREVLADIEGLTVVEGSINDKSLVDKCFSEFQPTHVIHSAASYKDPRNWAEDSATNVGGTINVVEAALEYNVDRFVNFQTALCYGRPLRVPIPVDAPTAPFTSYGISKAAGEHYIAMSGLPYVSLRLANVTGPRLSIGPIPTFYKRLKNNQSCFVSETVRDFLDMEDFLDVMDIVLEKNSPVGIFNISTGEGHSIQEVFDRIVSHLDIELTEPVKVVAPGDDDVPAVVLDPQYTHDVLDWKAKFDFESTITRMLEWYDRHGVNDIYSHLSTPENK